MKGYFQGLKGVLKLAKYAFLVAFLGTSANAAAWDKDEFVKFDKNKGANMQVLIIGANGSVAKMAIQGFLQSTNVNLKLFLRKASRLDSLANANSQRVQLIDGDATDINALKKAMKGVNVVYANLAGSNLGQMARSITQAMREVGVERLVWVGSYGVYDGEIPNDELDRIRTYNPPHREAVRVIEASGLNYTIIRAQWFSSADEIDYELTRKGEKFKNPSAYISRKSIAHLVIRLCLERDFGIKESFGINKPAR